MSVDPGFRPDHVLSFSVNLPSASYREPQRQHQFFGRAIEAAAVLPGIRSAGLVFGAAVQCDRRRRALVSVEGEPPWELRMRRDTASSHCMSAGDYFRAMGIALSKAGLLRPAR